MYKTKTVTEKYEKGELVERIVEEIIDDETKSINCPLECGDDEIEIYVGGILISDKKGEK